MASRYWVGGGASTNFNATGNTNWSATSGGANNASVPGSTDDVIFDSNSGSGTATVSAGITFQSLVMTGFTGTLAGGSQINFTSAGTIAVTFDTTFTKTWTGTLNFNLTGTANLSANGMVLNTVSKSGTGTLSIQSALSCSNLTSTVGTITTNNYAITCSTSLQSTGSGVAVWNMGSSLVTLTGVSGTYQLQLSTSANLTFNAGTSEIRFTGTANTTAFVILGGKTLNIVRFARGTSTGLFDIRPATGSTISQLIDDGTAAHTLQFTISETLNVGSLTINNTSNVVSLVSSSAGTQFTLSKASGSVSVNNVSIKDSNATGGATWTATNSTDAGNNTGWTITAPPAASIVDLRLAFL